MVIVTRMFPLYRFDTKNLTKEFLGNEGFRCRKLDPGWYTKYAAAEKVNEDTFVRMFSFVAQRRREE